jgi:hypothetical protein
LGNDGTCYITAECYLNIASEQNDRLRAEVERQKELMMRQTRLNTQAIADAMNAEEEVERLKAALRSIVALSERHVTAHAIAKRALGEK